MQAKVINRKKKGLKYLFFNFKLKKKLINLELIIQLVNRKRIGSKFYFILFLVMIIKSTSLHYHRVIQIVFKNFKNTSFQN